MVESASKQDSNIRCILLANLVDNHQWQVYQYTSLNDHARPPMILQYIALVDINIPIAITCFVFIAYRLGCRGRRTDYQLVVHLLPQALIDRSPYLSERYFVYLQLFFAYHSSSIGLLHRTLLRPAATMTHRISSFVIKLDQNGPYP